MCFFWSQSSLLRVLNIFGFFPFQIETFNKNRKSFCLSLFSQIFIILVVLLPIYLKSEQSSIQRGIFLVFGTIHSILLPFTLISIMINVLLLRGEFINFLKHLKDFELNVFKLTRSKYIPKHLEKMKRKCSFKVKFLIVCSILLITFESCLIISANVKRKIYNYYAMSISILTQMSLILTSLYISFILLLLMNMVKIFGTYLKEISKLKLNEQVKIHEDIKVLIQKFSNTFGSIIFFNYLYTFSNCAYEFFLLFAMTFLNDTNLSIRFIFFSLIYNLPMWPNLIFIYGLCKESSKIHQIYHDIPIKSINESDKLQLIIFDNEEEMKVHSSGMFYINKSSFYEVSN
jgi:hypothetical protein